MVIPVVGECDDSYLNDNRRMVVEHEDVVAAWQAAMDSRGSATPPTEGAVGSGTGMSCFDFKGGIGLASRVTPAGHTIGVLLMTNFGVREECTVAGVPVGRLLGPAPEGPPAPAGSCIGLVVTDAPVDGAACARLARRIGLGLARKRLGGPPRQRRDLQGPSAPACGWTVRVGPMAQPWSLGVSWTHSSPPS